MGQFQRPCTLGALILLGSSLSLNAADFEALTTADGTIVEFAIALPPSFEAGTPAPVMLALPPGPQTKRAVIQGLRDYWAGEAGRRGWVVVSPAAIDGMLFFRGAERVIPELLDYIATRFNPPNGKVHLSGISNGGLSAFHIALKHPARFSSLAVYAGFPPEENGWRRLDTLKGLRIAMYVGEEDVYWKNNMDRLKAAFDSLGIDVHYDILPDTGHVLRALKGTGAAPVFDKISP